MAPLILNLGGYDPLYKKTIFSKIIIISYQIVFLFQLICTLPCGITGKSKHKMYFLYGSEQSVMWGAATAMSVMSVYSEGQA